MRNIAISQFTQGVQFLRGLQHGEGIQYVVGTADGLVGLLAGGGQFALALSGEVRLRLGIAQA